MTEAARLDALRRYDILDTPPDGAFDHITRLAARIYDVPISLVSLVDHDRIWFKSTHGLDVREIGRDPGLCASVILTDAAYIVRDALSDTRTLDNPLVRGELGLRFYAAAPLVTHDGHRLGTVNIIDFEPRDFTAEDAASLLDLAALVMDQMELRRAAREATRSLGRAFQASDSAGARKELLTVCAWTNKIRIDGRWMNLEDFLVEQLGAQVSHGIHPSAAASIIDEE